MNHGVICNLGEKEFAIGISYVGISRVKKWEQLAFENMQGYKRFSEFFKWNRFKQRLAEDERILGLQRDTLARIDAQEKLELQQQTLARIEAQDQMEVDEDFFQNMEEEPEA